MIRQLVLTCIGLSVASGVVRSQVPVLEQRSMSGPRMGITFVTGQRGLDVLAQHNISSPMSQFGWHFEQQVTPRGSGPSFVTEEVLLVGAVEQRTAVPAATFLMGIRMPSGFEFGLGPNVTPVGSALAVGAGTSLRYGGVSVPLDFAVVMSPGATRFSFLVGYALQRS